jgi:sugar phosphate isomerase/epimerase
MSFRNVVNDGSANPPRMRIQQSMWGMIDLAPGGGQWSLIERLDKIAGAGFGGIESNCKTEQEADELAGLLDDRKLALGYIAHAPTVDDLLPHIEFAHRARAEYLTIQVKGSLKASPEIADLLKEMYAIVNDAGLPLFIETHRDTVTQDLRRTNKVIKRLKKIRFTGDFSHYVVAGSLGYPWSEEIWENFRPIAERCSCWHGRIGFGQQVQNDIGDGSGELSQQFRKLWAMGMTGWMKQAVPGDILPFTCELGPIYYSIPDLSGKEISNRWQQALVIRQLANEAWADAQSTPVTH